MSQSSWQASNFPACNSSTFTPGLHGFSVRKLMALCGFRMKVKKMSIGMPVGAEFQTYSPVFRKCRLVFAYTFINPRKKSIYAPFLFSDVKLPQHDEIQYSHKFISRRITWAVDFLLLPKIAVVHCFMPINIKYHFVFYFNFKRQSLNAQFLWFKNRSRRQRENQFCRFFVVIVNYFCGKLVPTHIWLPTCLTLLVIRHI